MLLLHMCCAPCAIYPVSVLKDENIEFEGLFYNPNVHPYKEFTRRRDTLSAVADSEGWTVNFCDAFMQPEWEAFQGDEGKRCMMCYALRLDKTAEMAKEKGFDSFTTTLLVSPYQKHELIIEICEKAALKHGVEFLYKDFRPGFRQGQQKAKELGLYRQKFCGCLFSSPPIIL